MTVYSLRGGAFVLLALLAGAAQADAWDRLYGRWTGRGEVSGMAADVGLEFRRTLDGQGRHLSFANRMTGKDGKVWLFRAEALYLCDAVGSCRGHWYDNRGMVLPLTVVTREDRVVVDWGEEATERGRTTYRLMGDGQVEIIDEVLDKSGAWRQFGRIEAERQAGP